MAVKKPDLDEPTLRIMERMMRMPPKPHGKMKLGKAAAKRSSSAKIDNQSTRLKDGGPGRRSGRKTT